ncbi:hypothetical protein BJY00DRAFT_307032 [Aspergillus carlsbadensis]|nr:hypothetical protein BJY00DRAFT_307032 [Aspergillus carlsbadensis]
MEACSWMKLRLNAETNLAQDHGDDVLSIAAGLDILRLPQGKDVTHVIADYLGEIYELLYKILKTSQDQACPPLEIMLPIPATWTPKARALTKMAVERAGFGARNGHRRHVISEPEAAANAVLREERHRLSGAVYRGMRGGPLATFQPFLHYGVEDCQMFSTAAELQRLQDIDVLNRREMDTGRAAWLLRKEPYNQDFRFSKSMCYVYSEGKPCVVPLPFYGCRLDAPPDHIGGDAVVLVGRILIDFTKLTLTNFAQVPARIVEITAQAPSTPYVPGAAGPPDIIKLGMLTLPMRDLPDRKGNDFLRSLGVEC